MFQRTTLISVMLTCFFNVLPIWAEMLPAGTELVIQLEKEFQRESESNEKFRASLTFPVFIDGREVVPVGSKIEGEVRGTKKAVFLSPRHLIFPDGRRVDFNATVSEIDHKRLEAEQMEGVIEEKGSSGAPSASGHQRASARHPGRDDAGLRRRGVRRGRRGYRPGAQPPRRREGRGRRARADRRADFPLPGARPRRLGRADGGLRPRPLTSVLSPAGERRGTWGT